MEEKIAKCIDRVCFLCGEEFDQEFSTGAIVSFNDSYDEFELELCSSFDILKRGWFGDIVYTTRYTDGTTSDVRIHDAILIRVYRNGCLNDPVDITYIFNKF